MEAKKEGEKIPIHIFPTKKFRENLNKDSEHFPFWENLKTVFDDFEENRKLSFIAVESDGRYKIKVRD